MAMADEEQNAVDIRATTERVDRFCTAARYLCDYRGSVAPGDDWSVPRRDRRPSARKSGSNLRPWWELAIAAGITVSLVVAFGASPLHSVFLEGASQLPAASRSLVGDDKAPPRVTAVPASAATPTTTTVPRPVTTAVTTARRRTPGLGLLPQPEPTPVALPSASAAPVFSRIPTTNKVIFLGIDDGIVRDPAVVDLLRQANIPFTMFLVKGEADAGTDYFRQLQAVGGVVEDHTITHPDLTKVSYGQLQTEVCGSLDDFQALFGRRPTLFRPPYGLSNANVQAAVASCGLKAVVLWKGSTNDGRFDLQEGTQLTPGDVVLMHFRTDLLANLQKVFEVCRQQGFAIASLEDYLPS
jgi:peptidoglycan/xylan/chitin deacetylase (PgdA/CDA1 family)